jgi:hypothetical protein
MEVVFYVVWVCTGFCTNPSEYFAPKAWEVESKSGLSAMQACKQHMIQNPMNKSAWYDGSYAECRFLSDMPERKRATRTSKGATTMCTITGKQKDRIICAPLD